MDSTAVKQDKRFFRTMALVLLLLIVLSRGLTIKHGLMGLEEGVVKTTAFGQFDKVFQLVQEGHGLELRLVQRHLLCVFFLGVAVEVVVIQEVG